MNTDTTERRSGKDRRKLKRICFGPQKSGRRKLDLDLSQKVHEIFRVKAKR